MTKARQEQVDLSSTPYYHCICRCVRRAFLCGQDHLTGNNYEHRKAWVVERLSELSNVFSIDVCAYAVMSNHYHIVLRVDQDKANALNETQVVDCWKLLFKVPLLIERYFQEQITQAEKKEAQKLIEQWRARLMDLSWYMRSLNEHLARRANEEDQCKGRFWEGRYKSQALLDEAAVLTCMSYVDLNPIRAGIADTPEESDYTSIKQRISHCQKKQSARGVKKNGVGKQNSSKKSISSNIPLMPLAKASLDSHPNAIGFTLRDYLEFVDWAGRAIRSNKSGAIPENLPSILMRLRLNPNVLIDHLSGNRSLSRSLFPSAMGAKEKLKSYAARLDLKFIRGQGLSLSLFQPTI